MYLLLFFFCAVKYRPALNTNYLDAYFETMSGFTTTGITMFQGLDILPKSIIFWRALIQWIGGLGILTLFLAILYHRGSAHRLFSAESHKIETSRPVPGLANTIKIPTKAKSIGMKIKEIVRHKKFPSDCVFMGIYREAIDEFLIPRGEHKIMAGDLVFLIVKKEFIDMAVDLLAHEGFRLWPK